MHATVSIPHPTLVSEWQTDFTRRVMPAVQNFARLRFRKDRDKTEKTQSAIALAWKAYVDLRRQGREDRIFPGPIARYAVAQVAVGRCLGSSLNINDPLSPYCRQRREITVTNFGDVHELPPELHEALGEHDRAPVPDQAAFRVDFPRWLGTLSARARAVADHLMVGHGTGKVARLVNLSPARVSQLRRELMDSWTRFHEPMPAA